MKNRPNFQVEIDGQKGEIFVSDNAAGTYVCIFIKMDAFDFADLFRAYGFMVRTGESTRAGTEYFSIRSQRNTKLTYSVMDHIWTQISSQLEE